MGGTWFDEGTQLNIAREVRRYSLPTVLSPAGQAFRVSLGGRSLARSDHPVPPDVRPDLDTAIDHIVDEPRRVTFGSYPDNPDLHDLDIPFSELVAPYSDQQLVDEYLSMEQITPSQPEPVICGRPEEVARSPSARPPWRGLHDSPSGPACSWHTWPPMTLPCQGRAISCLVTRTEETYYYSQNSQTSWLGFE